MAAEHTIGGGEIAGLAGLDLGRLLDGGDVGACCAALYEHPAVHWLLGGELHPGGEATTRRAFELLALDRADRLLDVGCGDGGSALLAVGERGCEAVGVDLGETALERGAEAASASGLGSRASFRRANAEALPFAEASFSAVLCECAVSTFAEKAGALAEMRRVLGPGGRIAISDVVADRASLPEQLRGPLAAVACVGDALDAPGYGALLRRCGFEPTATESHDAQAARLAARVEDRLRGARLLGIGGLEEPIAMARLAREAIEEGVLGYSTFVAIAR